MMEGVLDERNASADGIIREDIERIVRNLDGLKDKIKDRTFLVTGGAGFLGSWLCDVLLSMGAKVICVDNLSSGSMDNIRHLEKLDDFKFFNCDVCAFGTEKNLDYIAHMASIASPPLYQRMPIETLDTNIIGTKRMLELALEKKVGGFLLTSTSEVYGDPSVVPTPETYHGNVDPFGPRSMYNEGKRAAESYCYSFFKQFSLPIRIARIFNTYGPKLDIINSSAYGRVITKFISQALSGMPLTVYGDGSQTRSFIYVSDQVEFLLRLLVTEGLDGSIVNIGSEDERSVLDLATLVLKLTGSSSEIGFEPLPEADPKRRKPDITTAKKLLGFQQAVDLETGLRRTITWYNLKI